MIPRTSDEITGVCPTSWSGRLIRSILIHLDHRQKNTSEFDGDLRD